MEKTERKNKKAIILLIIILFLLIIVSILFIFCILHVEKQKEIKNARLSLEKLTIEYESVSKSLSITQDSNNELTDTFNAILAELEKVDNNRKSAKYAITQSFVNKFDANAYISVITCYGIIEHEYSENSNQNGFHIKPPIEVDTSLILSASYKGSIGINYNSLDFSIQDNILNVSFSLNDIMVLGIEFFDKSIKQQTVIGNSIPIIADSFFYANHAISFEKVILETTRSKLLTENKEMGLQRVEELIVTIAKEFGLKIITINGTTYKLI